MPKFCSPAQENQQYTAALESITSYQHQLTDSNPEKKKLIAEFIIYVEQLKNSKRPPPMPLLTTALMTILSFCKNEITAQAYFRQVNRINNHHGLKTAVSYVGIGLIALGLCAFGISLIMPAVSAAIFLAAFVLFAGIAFSTLAEADLKKNDREKRPELAEKMQFFANAHARLPRNINLIVDNAVGELNCTFN